MMTQEQLEERFSPEIVKWVEKHPSNEPLNQRVLFRLVSQSISRLEDWRQENRLGMAAIVITILFAALVGFAWGSLGLIYLACDWLLGSYTDIPLYLVSAVAFITFTLQGDHEAKIISLNREDDLVTGLSLGRLEEFFDGAAALAFGFVGMVIGLHAGLIQFSHNNLGIPNVDGVLDAVLIAIDSSCRAVFWDVFDLYGIYFGRAVDLTPWAATVFLLFRIAVNAAVVFGLYQFWNRLRLTRMIRRLSVAGRKQEELGRVLKEIRRGRWSRQLLDEYTLLLAVDHFLAGRFDEVKRLSFIYPRLKVSEDVKQLFQGPDGKPLLTGYRTVEPSD